MGETDPFPQTSLHVRRALDGDTDSLSWVVGRLSPLLVSLAAYRLAPRLRAIYDPEDLVSDAWLITLPHLDQLKARDGRFTPVLLKYLSTTLVRQINNLARKHIYEIGSRGSGTETSGAPSGVTPDPHSGVVTQAIRAETRSVIRATIDELEPRDREILLLRGIEQLANESVAMLLGMQPSAVSARYMRALERLRARLPGAIFDELDGG